MSRIETVPIGYILRARRSAHFRHTKDRLYITDRGLGEYEHGLPQFKGKGVSELIEDKIDQGIEPINVLDIGCGEGNFLASLVHRYPQIRAFGISAFDYRQKTGLWGDRIKQVDYRLGDAQRLASVFPDVEFDLVVSRHCLEYTDDPLSVLKQAYRRSKIGGVILLDRLGTLLNQLQAKNLKAYWEQNGIQADLERYFPGEDKYDRTIYKLAIQKASNNKLPLPFRYSYRGEGVLLNYSFDEEAVARTVTHTVI